ncbi:MAG: AraC family transcriptional regulator [Muribaculaceae bacterium]|nr:AraC family transcriptional regulator [Muribaculaceae bacterium]
MSTIQREITPINDDDLFILLNHPEADFDYATHFHTDFELNLVLHDKGKRVVGDSIEEFPPCDLVLIGPNIPHRWQGEIVKGNQVITIQFHDQLLSYQILQKKMFNSIKEMLQKSNRGIQFVEDEDSNIVKQILQMSKINGFKVCLEFLSLLYELSTSPNQRLLASRSFDSDSVIRDSKSRRIAKICDYINKNHMNQIKLSDLAETVSMSDSALSHFFKKRTNRNLVDYINDVRIGNATKMLFETTHSINEIAFLCGFNNISNFNRIFKKNRGKTPTEYRESIQKILTKF